MILEQEIDLFTTTKLYDANLASEALITVNQGGTSSGKTYSIDQVLFTKLFEQEKKVCTIVGQDIPNLRVGALRDALEIYDNSPGLKRAIRSYNKAALTFTFNNGSIMEFKSYDSPQDAKSGKRDYLFINEANGIPYPIFKELYLRTYCQTYIDYNPNSEFWVHEHLIGQPHVKLLISDHRNNPFLPQHTRDSIEALKHEDEELWRVYARGLTGKIEGLVFRNWSLCESIPEDAKYIGTGLDFGFTNDPTASVDVYEQDGELWVEEGLYETRLTNPEIAAKLKNKKQIIADSAEPKSIEEIKRFELDIEGAQKGADSIKNSIDILKRYHLNITRGSVNLRKELNNYKWRVDKLTGKSINEPIDAFNHCFVGSTLIETIEGLKPINTLTINDKVLTRKGYKSVNKIFLNGHKKICSYTLNFGIFTIRINCTPNHKILTDKGWQPIEKITCGATIYLSRNITDKKQIKQNCGEEWTMPEHLLLSGMGVRKAGSGTGNMVKTLRTIYNRRNIRANVAEVNTSLSQLAQKGSVATTANLNLEESMGLTMKNDPVPFAADFLPLINMPKDKHAQPIVLESINPEYEAIEEVFDIEVDQQHEYFANGVLVHNCIDALRYVALNRLRKEYPAYDLSVLSAFG